MKKSVKLFATLLMCAIFLKLNGQVKTKVFYSEPPVEYKTRTEKVEKIITVKGSVEFYSKLKDSKETSENEFATQVKTELDIIQASFLKSENDFLIYTLTILAEDAKNISISFSDFNLSRDAKLSLFTKYEYTDDITFTQNNKSRIWASRVYQGNSIFIVLKTKNKKDDFDNLKIGAINFGYKKFGNSPDFGNVGVSANCQVNANCPLGNGWDNEKNSIALIVANGGTLCTGSLIMNTCNSRTPYLLTANHCLAAGNVPNWVFQFQTLSADCNTNVGWREDIQFNGCILRANNASSDFALLELTTIPPSNSGLFYSGWSRDTINNTSTTTLHHPFGDLMKIARDNDAPVPFNDIQFNVDIWFLRLDAGIVEAGSSGAPYYNQDHRIIGQHFRRPQNTGTVNPTPCLWNQTMGGRFNVSWIGGGTNATRLSNWLDPLNTNALTTNTTNISTLLASSPVNGILNFNLSKYTTGLDCNSLNVAASVPLNNTINWTTTNGALINGNQSPYTTTYGNSVTIYSPNGLDCQVTASITNGGCNILKTVSFCPCLPWSDPNPIMIYAPQLIGEPLNASVDEFPDAISYQWYVGNQLVDVTNNGYLWTTNWPCLGNPSGLSVIAVTSCGRTIPVGFGGEINCYSYYGRSTVTNNSGIKLFPNPAFNSIIVSINNDSKQLKIANNLNSISQISIFDNLGVLKLSKQFAKTTKQVEIDISKLRAGMYFIEVFDGKTKQRKQFIKN